VVLCPRRENGGSEGRDLASRLRMVAVAAALNPNFFIVHNTTLYYYLRRTHM